MKMQQGHKRLKEKLKIECGKLELREEKEVVISAENNQRGVFPSEDTKKSGHKKTRRMF